MINPVWLHTFRTLIEVGHFTQTAEKLYMTQPGVSQHIKKLETACKHALIKREGKSFELTEQGRIVYHYAVKLEKESDSLMDQLNFDNPNSGRCSLACSGSLALLLYPKLLLLQTEHQGLSIQLESAPNKKILNDLDTGLIDIGIVTHQPNSSLYQSNIVGNEELCLVMPNRYNSMKLTTDTLFECGLIGHPDANHYLSLYFELCGNNDLEKINLDEIPRTGYINQLSQILLPVTKGLGFTVLPRGALDSFADKTQLHIASTQFPVKETLYLVQKRHRNLPARYEKICSLIKEALT
ncbi:LysR family transcriptional regulator [Vibrio sp. ZSDE26]|uniref:LysR family transcriptional regulator n=1 Tax=Vibrio amylolyticus TaxID=2847292 RepID=A0A9X1XNX9_9VIBR|nr:LysR family transcriptional regulator [Vibrio amylolyticus]MCK6262914.1 LysR family transcriptional regulator [Vibrio amylolyticus]